MGLAEADEMAKGDLFQVARLDLCFHEVYIQAVCCAPNPALALSKLLFQFFLGTIIERMGMLSTIPLTPIPPSLPNPSARPRLPWGR